MKQTKLEFLVGVFVLIGLAAVAYLTLKLGAGSLLGGDTYMLEARFTNTSGLNTGSNVVVAGVPVGRVEEIRVEPTDYSAIVTLRVNSGLHLPTDSMASIKTTGLIGDKFISRAIVGRLTFTIVPSMFPMNAPKHTTSSITHWRRCSAIT